MRELENDIAALQTDVARMKENQISKHDDLALKLDFVAAEMDRTALDAIAKIDKFASDSKRTIDDMRQVIGQEIKRATDALKDNREFLAGKEPAKNVSNFKGVPLTEVTKIVNEADADKK